MDNQRYRGNAMQRLGVVLLIAMLMPIPALAEDKSMLTMEESLKQGNVPLGYQRKKFDPITQTEYVESDSRLGRMARAINTALTQSREREKRQTEKFQKQAEMYKALIDAGYDPKTAHEAALELKFPERPPRNSDNE